MQTHLVMTLMGPARPGLATRRLASILLLFAFGLWPGDASAQLTKELKGLAPSMAKVSDRTLSVLDKEHEELRDLLALMYVPCSKANDCRQVVSYARGLWLQGGGDRKMADAMDALQKEADTFAIMDEFRSIWNTPGGPERVDLFLKAESLWIDKEYVYGAFERAARGDAACLNALVKLRNRVMADPAVQARVHYSHSLYRILGDLFPRAEKRETPYIETLLALREPAVKQAKESIEDYHEEVAEIRRRQADAAADAAAQEERRWQIEHECVWSSQSGQRPPGAGLSVKGTDDNGRVLYCD